MDAVVVDIAVRPVCMGSQLQFDLWMMLLHIWYINQNIGAQRLINLEIPVLVRSLKSSNVELG